ncbi:MAG: Carboxy-terminal domain (CTD) phosphatase [Candelina mexicana]|nr:MAG: Carboxy-terminal domain (CTD) phosphatase [Candelina mexicana]
MLLHLPHNLHYPITVTELLRQPNDTVERFAPLFSYFYKTTVTEDDKYGDSREVEKTYPTRYESPVVGVLKQWKIKAGAVITHSRVEIAEIDEPCPHSMQYGGMCTMCGKDMTEIAYVAEFSDADRAKVTMIHDNTSLTVSQEEATRVEEEGKRRLLAATRLSLVVDLDQTIIQATVDPTVAEWQQDKDNPNHDAVKDVRAFQLIDDGPGGRGCWYYIKLRPGLERFLEDVSKLYELHIYTMGTRAYAKNIAKIVDPDRKIFGDRILSRDESGSLTAKNLQRLFPIDTKMVVIIDDRGDVWKWSENLIKVTPYDFFVGIGDINSSFLPKKPELTTGPKDTSAAVSRPDKDLIDGTSSVETKIEPNSRDDNSRPVHSPPESTPAQMSNAPAKNDLTALEQLVTMGGGSDPNLLQAQATKQDETLAAQQQERPLLQKQKQLDAEDAAAADAANAEGSGENGEETTHDSQKQRQNLLRDDDVELYNLRQVLTEVHRVFFAECDRLLGPPQAGRIAQLRGEPRVKKINWDLRDLDLVPDVKLIMPRMKRSVLEGCVLVFSGLLPLGVDVFSSDIALQARRFGAQVHENITKRTTHVVAARNRTAKVRQAARNERIMIVTPQWLFDCISRWEHAEEEDYLIPVHPEDRRKLDSTPGSTSPDKSSFGGADVDENAELSSSGEDGEGGGDTDDESKNLTIRTEGLEDIEDDAGRAGVTVSPTNVDWDAMKDELAEFEDSGSDDSDDSDDESGTESVESDVSNHNSRKRKGPPSAGSTDEEQDGEGEGDDPNGSPLSRRKRRALERTTSLTDVSAVNDQPIGSSGSNHTEPSNDTIPLPNGGGDGGYQEEDDDDIDLETALLAEMEAQQEREDSEVQERERSVEQKPEQGIETPPKASEGHDSGG